ncbi:uncharacterized protein LOC134843207 [Symsagittifera roscoffensis]|uniref:uncharacterized protein LOC134843207 n=1 Tax=Symsagittifera roscoffensis TaxID=84072 RepID=UPI00307C60D4
MSFMSNSSGPYDVLIKVMMLGHSSVGKSSMVSSLCEQPFSPSHLHTIGIDFRVKHYHLKGKRVKLQVWDSAGQERYDTIIKPYYREAQAFVLVFDLTNRDTFDQASLTYLSRVAPLPLPLPLPYYREAQAFVLVFDLTNRDTFDQASLTYLS